MQRQTGRLKALRRVVTAGAIAALTASSTAALLGGAPALASGQKAEGERYFERIATFPVILNQGDPSTDNDIRLLTPVAEIVDHYTDETGALMLVYTDSELEQIGFVDLLDPANPAPAGLLAMPGEPTSVAVAGDYALVGVNTSASFTDTSGLLVVVDLASQSVVESFELGGQPDSVAVSPDGRYAAVAIENERDEDLESPDLTPEEGGLPQLPAGFLVIVDLVGLPANWSTRSVDLTGIAEFAPSDPEPEFVDINGANIAAVTLQENNHIVFVHLPTGRVIQDFPAGSAALENVDTEDNGLIQLEEDITEEREPDAITWLGNGHVATADEGDLLGGSRGFTIFNRAGNVAFAPGAGFEHEVVRRGHYPEGRSDNKGAEPEGVESARFGKTAFLFVGAERAGLVGVYAVRGPGKPRLLQFLPTAIGPEGVKAIPEAGLLVVASEVDITADRLEDDPNPLAGFRSVISVYRLRKMPPSYPTLIAADRPGDPALPIPWAALSALASGPALPGGGFSFFTLHDSFFDVSRLYRAEVGPGFPDAPAEIVDEIVLTDPADAFDFDGDGDGVFEFDLEGLALRPDGGFWAVSEGRQSVGGDREFNRLIKLAADGEVLDVVELPAATQALQVPFGFEGVAVVGSGDDETVYVAFQREWTGDPDGRVRIARYVPKDDAWTFFYYPIETPSPVAPGGPAGWIGLSEIIALDETSFAVVERDNRIGMEAAVKQICSFSVAGVTPGAEGQDFPVLVKSDPCFDLLPALEAANGIVLDKVEGLMVGADDRVYIVTDNDGVDDAPGETQFIDLGPAAAVIPPVPVAD